MKPRFAVKTTGLEEIDHKIAEFASESEAWLANEVLKDTEQFVPARTVSRCGRCDEEEEKIVIPDR